MARPSSRPLELFHHARAAKLERAGDLKRDALPVERDGVLTCCQRCIERALGEAPSAAVGSAAATWRPTRAGSIAARSSKAYTGRDRRPIASSFESLSEGDPDPMRRHDKNRGNVGPIMRTRGRLSMRNTCQGGQRAPGRHARQP